MEVTRAHPTPLHQQKWDLADDEWKYDQIPEILDGKNVADWIDPDIEQKLKVLLGA